MRYLSEFFWRYSWDFGTFVQNKSNFFNVYQSVCWLSSLLELDKYRDISSFGRDISLNFFGDISGMLAGHFQIFLNFLYVCQSVTCLTSFLILYKYKDNSSSRGYIFLKFLGDILGTIVHQFQIFLIFLYVCQSVSWPTHLLKLDKYRDVSSSG